MERGGGGNEVKGGKANKRCEEVSWEGGIGNRKSEETVGGPIAEVL